MTKENCESIIIPGNVKYLSDYFSELPKNCLFNKGITGAGGTTIALTDKNPTVICVPYVSLITNKISQANGGNSLYPHKIFGFYGGISNMSLKTYLAEVDVPKILVTYDSLGKLTEEITPKKYNILVDEYHCLFTAYSFREYACQTVLNNYNKYKNYTFMTATPIEEDFRLEELSYLPVVKAVWDNVQEVHVIPVRGGKSVRGITINTVNKFQSGDIIGNAYFFVNSVKFINEIVRYCNLSDANTRVIYSDNNPTRIANGISRGNTTDSPRKINFITSTAFEGCDLYDSEGKTIIISDGNKEHTLLDIQIQIPQIIGRLRDSEYRKCIYHIYSNSKDYDRTKLTYEEYHDIVKIGLANGQRLVNRFNDNPADHDFRISLTENVSNHFRSKLPGIEYIKKDTDGNLILDKNRSLIALWNYRTANATYLTKESLSAEYDKANITTARWEVDYSNFEVIPSGNFNFKEACKFLKLVYKKRMMGIDLDLEEIHSELECYESYNYLKNIIDRLGFEIIEQKDYNITNLKRLAVVSEVSNSPEELNQSIFNLLMLTGYFKKASFVSNIIAKKALITAYKEVGFMRNSITANTIHKFFNAKEALRGKRDARVGGFIILDYKYDVLN